MDSIAYESPRSITLANTGTTSNPSVRSNVHCEVLAIGELLVDYIETPGDSPTGGSTARAPQTAPDVAVPTEVPVKPTFAQAPGGAPANVAATCATLGIRSGFIGKIGDDARGRFLAKSLVGAGIDPSGLVVDSAYTTTAAFARIDPASGELTYSFDRNPGADAMLRADELDLLALSAAAIVHVGTFSLISEPSRSATLDAVDAAHKAGHLASCDINLRPLAWHSQDAMLSAAKTLVEKSDLLKVSSAELDFLCGTVKSPCSLANPTANVSVLLSRGPRLVAVTFGDQGAYLATHTACAQVPAFAVTNVVDTAGAGDVFWGATLAWLLRTDAALSSARINQLSNSDLLTCGRFACAAASCSVEKRGALGSAPTLNEITKRLERI